jgi:hypothetical protein
LAQPPISGEYRRSSISSGDPINTDTTSRADLVQAMASSAVVRLPEDLHPELVQSHFLSPDRIEADLGEASTARTPLPLGEVSDSEPIQIDTPLKREVSLEYGKPASIHSPQTRRSKPLGQVAFRKQLLEAALAKNPLDPHDQNPVSPDPGLGPATQGSVDSPEASKHGFGRRGSLGKLSARLPTDVLIGRGTRQEISNQPREQPSSVDATGIRLLSLDDGGKRGLSTLHALKHIMDQLNSGLEDGSSRKPCEVFDLIGGIGTGGYVKSAISSA